jgi:hypothetical protein
MRRLLGWLVLLSTVLPGCAQLQSSYEDRLAQIAPPADDSDRQRKCDWIRSEMARERSIAPPTSSRTGMYADAGQIQSRHNIAALQSRAGDFGCAASSGNRP